MKQAILTIVGLVVLVMFFLLPKNQSWFNNRIVGYWNDFNFQRHNLEPEVRKIERWGNSYVFSKQIAEHLSRQGSRNALVLLPPTAYFKERDVDYHVPEPAVFYYYTGVKTTWINSKQSATANWMVSADHGQLKIIPVKDKQMMNDSLAVFNKYPVKL
ncbi:MAG: hypothetical protein ACXVBH_08515 [Flavisolibacter sp.]